MSQNDCRLSQDGSSFLRLMEPGCDEKMKDVCYIVHMCCVCYFCSAHVFGVFLASVECGVSLSLREAYPSAELLTCGGEPLCC
jgi:hypothetical protein